MMLPLYHEFCKWAEGGGGLPEKDFGQRIEALGFQRQHTNSGNVYLGLALMNAADEKGEP
jgi:hypothetical protein